VICFVEKYKQSYEGLGLERDLGTILSGENRIDVIQRMTYEEGGKGVNHTALLVI